MRSIATGGLSVQAASASRSTTAIPTTCCTPSPILEEFSLPATFFLTSGYLQGGNDFWWDALERPFFRKEQIPSTLEIEIERALLTFDFAGDTEYRDSAFARSTDSGARGTRRSRSGTAPTTSYGRFFIGYPARLGNGCSTPSRTGPARAPMASAPRARPLSSQEVRQLASGPGIEIGGHSVTHSSLPLLDREAQRREIVENKRRLEELLGRPLQHFSYPHGEHSDETVSLLKQAGYEAACTTQAFAVERSVDIFRLPRICVEDWNGDEFARRLNHRFVED